MLLSQFVRAISMISNTMRKGLHLTLLPLFLLLFTQADLSAQRFDPVDFDTTECGAQSCRTFEFRSLGNGEEIIDLFMINSILFTQSPPATLPLPIPDGGSVNIGLCFSPKTAGPFTDSLRVIVSTGAPDPDTVFVDIRGFGGGEGLVIEPLDITFPETDAGSVSTETVLVYNVGSEDVTLDQSDFTDVKAPFGFADPTIFPLTLKPGDSLEVDLEFSPLRQGAYGTVNAILRGCGDEIELVMRGLTSQLIEEGFGEVACDSVLCDTLWVAGIGSNERIISINMRDSISFVLDSDITLPFLLPAGDSIGIPICFTPTRRGNIVDSLVMVVRRGPVDEVAGIRLSGIGVGPNLEVEPPVLNFPRITVGQTSLLATKLINSGERSITVTAADLMIPPPFQLNTVLPITIGAGDTIDLEIEFIPTERGIFSVPIEISAGCLRLIELGLNGSTDFIGTGGVLRVTKVGFSPANDERVPCDFSQCTDVTLSNVGNATLIVEAVDWANGSLGYTLTPPPATPLTIPANESRTIRVCIDAQQAGTLRDTLLVRSNDRRSIAFGLVIDESLSMDTALACGANPPSRLEEALKQAEVFIDNTLLFLPALNIQDQVAVTLYSGTARFPSRPVVENVYPLTNVTDPTRTAAKASLATAITRGGTWTGEAVREMIRTLAASPLPDRVIVLLTDGVASDESQNPVGTIVSEANAAGVRIFTIGIGLSRADAIAYLSEMSDDTRGLGFLANNCGSLQEAFSEITEVVSQGGVWAEPFQITVTSPQLLADDIEFDSLYIFDDTCTTLTLTNVGEGTALVTALDFTDLLGGATAEFYLEPGTTTFPLSIPENAQRQVRVCFRPNGLRERGGLLKATYNDCFAVDATGAVAGTGYAEANLRIDDERVTLPGQTVTLPVYGDSSLSGYGVNTIRWTMRWNRTMLELQGVRPGAASGGAAVLQTGPVIETGEYATVEIESSGGSALDPPGELALLDFEFLRGDTLAAYVEITSGVMEDGNPKLLRKNAGLVVHDSICFRELRPISYNGPASKLTLRSVTPAPSNGEDISVEIETTGAIGFALEVFDVKGSAVVGAERYGAGEGRSTLQLDVRNLPNGVYYLRITDDGGGVAFRKVVIRR